MKPEADDEGYGMPLEHNDAQFMTGLLVAALICAGLALWLA